jgi:hypothetical protein
MNRKGMARALAPGNGQQAKRGCNGFVIAFSQYILHGWFAIATGRFLELYLDRNNV